jgi:hypothetical protein
VGLERRRDGEICRRIPVENIDKFLLLDSGNHHSTALGIRGEKLSGDDAPAPALAKSLHCAAGIRSEREERKKSEKEERKRERTETKSNRNLNLPAAAAGKDKVEFASKARGGGGVVQEEGSAQ